MSHDRATSQPQLEAYLDGLLDPAERAAFEAQLARDPALRAAADAQRRIDASLRSMFSSDADRILERTRLATPRRAAPLVPQSPVLFWAKRIAAAIVIALLTTWLLLEYVVDTVPASDPRYAVRDVATIYRDTLAAGFNPDWRCETEQEFRDTFINRLGQTVTLAAAPGVESLGLSYANSLSPQTLLLLARVDGQPVIVFADRAVCDTQPQLDPATGLRLFRHHTGNLVLYELTPLNAPRVAPLLNAHDPPPSPPPPEPPAPGSPTGATPTPAATGC